MHRHDTPEEVLAEIKAGIIPVQMFYSKISSGLDPFENLSNQDALKLKRKWRKLKKKYSVKSRTLSSAAMVVKRKLKDELINKSC